MLAGVGFGFKKPGYTSKKRPKLHKLTNSGSHSICPHKHRRERNIRLRRGEITKRAAQIDHLSVNPLGVFIFYLRFELLALLREKAPTNPGIDAGR
jgi:hypothetical protein